MNGTTELLEDLASTGRLIGEMLGDGVEIRVEEVVTIITRLGADARKILNAPEDRVVTDLHGKEWRTREGLEGPIVWSCGRVVYYDRTEGAYYDGSTDLYLNINAPTNVWACWS
tara:strand:- start:2318 stop:2659 length:342 start_codon:yes stop_codon:yes gene_type:complete